LRRIAQTLRHAPGMRRLTPLWSMLRRPYLALLRRLGREGLRVHVGGFEMRVDALFATQNWEVVERDSYRAFAAMVRPGDVVFDIGAHIGTYSVIASRLVGPAGRVVAYEPVAFTRAYLERHLEWNAAAANTVVRPVCCADRTGTAPFHFRPGQAEGMNGLVPVPGFEVSEVELTTVDVEARSLGLTPDVLKIDVEGAELDVLKGAEDVLRRHGPRLSLSLHPAALAVRSSTPEAVLAWLSARGYDSKVIARDHEVHVVAAPRGRT
jgi:FkbM family methyltransferase